MTCSTTFLSFDVSVHDLTYLIPELQNKWVTDVSENKTTSNIDRGIQPIYSNLLTWIFKIIYHDLSFTTKTTF